MLKLANKELMARSVLLASVYSSLISNFFLLAYRTVLNIRWALFTSSAALTNVLAVAFILFTVILITSLKYVDKITRKLYVTILLLVTSASCFIITTTWIYELFILFFVIIAFSTAYLTPSMAKLISDFSNTEERRDFDKYIYPLSILIWGVISGLLFYFGSIYIWRYFLIITGSLNFAASIIIN
ncbi:MAG: hypothetical protein ACFE8N_00300 [Promethearchaeota archaeon]